MLSENFDKKIREAAEKHHPAYDESAWKKMENLLNQHLPQQKKDKRRIFLVLFTFLLLGGGAFFLLSKPHVSKTGQQVNNKAVSKNESPVDKTLTANNRAPVTQRGKEKKNSEITGSQLQPVDDGSTNSNTIQQHLLTNYQNAVRKKQVAIKPVNPGNGINNLSERSLTKEENINSTESKKEKSVQNNTSLQQNVGVIKNENKTNETAVVKEETKPGENEQAEALGKKTSTQKKKSGMNGLSFFVSAGPDVSKAGSSKAGKVTLTYGIGVSYTINRFTFRTGVYKARKIYWADPGEYQLSWTPPNVKFEGADANCQVIEIPVKVSYNFAFTDKSNWFAGAGLSSYLMKDEKYVLEYKTSSGAPYYHPYETKNENKHYFSILNLSAGYSRQLSKTFSVAAEPYLEIPMSGIGAGKIHLNSTGILFTVGVSPFRK